MQNRYSGDIGDYAKLGILRWFQKYGLSIGVNWYLVPDENHNTDGKYINYLKDKTFRECDDQLFDELQRIVESETRNVISLQNENILQANFYAKELNYTNINIKERSNVREKWHKQALKLLKRNDIVFVDPDNGLIVKSSINRKNANKYVTLDELKSYYEEGKSVIYYQHKGHISDSFYIHQHREVLKQVSNNDRQNDIAGLKFTKTSLRYFFFIIRPEHREKIIKAIIDLQKSPWNNYFTFLLT